MCYEAAGNQQTANKRGRNAFNGMFHIRIIKGTNATSVSVCSQGEMENGKWAGEVVHPE